MIDLNLLREQPDVVRKALADRQMVVELVDKVLALDESRRDLIQQTETLKAERNTVSKEIGRMKDLADRQARIDAVRQVGDKISQLDESLRAVEQERDGVLAAIPNLLDPRTPPGKDESENVVLRAAGQIPEFDFTPQPHWDLGPALGILDLERGVKITGSRFYVLSGAGARRQSGLIASFIDVYPRQGDLE